MKNKHWLTNSIPFALGFVMLFVAFTNSQSANALFEDFDQDGLSNEEEAVLGTDPYVADTDGDGYGDYTEVSGGYDPLKPAPGDKIIAEKSDSQSNIEKKSTTNEEDSNYEIPSNNNLTQKAAAQLAGLASEATTGGEEITLDSIESLVSGALDEASEPIMLPEVSGEDIRILDVDYEDMSDEERTEREREDAVEYLSAVAYIIVSSVPQRISFDSQENFSSVAEGEVMRMISGFSQGNLTYIREWADRGEQILEDMYEVEVPRELVDIHKRGIQIAQYAIELEGDVDIRSDDPIGSIAAMSQAQGFLMLVADYQDDVFSELESLGIEELPIDL